MNIIQLLVFESNFKTYDKVALFVEDHCLFADITIGDILQTYPYREVKEYTDTSITLSQISRKEPSLTVNDLCKLNRDWNDDTLLMVYSQSKAGTTSLMYEDSVKHIVRTFGKREVAEFSYNKIYLKE